MEAVVGAANWLLGKVLTKLADDLVKSFVAGVELRHNFQDIKRKLQYTQGLLQAAEGRDVSHNGGLRDLLQQLSSKADEAEDVLDELHYFMIRDLLDGTQEATVQEPAQDMRGAVRAHARDGRHALLHTVGTYLQCFSCSPTKDDCAATNIPQNITRSDNGSYVDKLTFNRAAMSSKIKSVIEDIHSLCGYVSDLLNKIPSNSTRITLTRPQRGSTIVQDELYGREVTLHRTVGDITGYSQTLSVLPVVGPGGIGKTTFCQHLYNDTRTKERFHVRVWICVSTDFDVLGLTKQILSCILSAEKQGSDSTHETSNLSQLQECIIEKLKSKRVLVVLDDLWKCDSKGDWETLLAPFSKGGTKGNLILVTTRFPRLADMVKTVENKLELQGLEFNDFFGLFEACIFGEGNKPLHSENDLTDIAIKIAKKLKGSPLAAKTVGRLLKVPLSREHWNGVLCSSEWENAANDDDIMPSLKISFDYLRFDLKKVFSYFALFPEDYRFNSSEMNRFWIAIGIIESGQQNDRNYLEELVQNGFLMKGDDDFCQYYVMHDLMHELSRTVSIQECFNISDLGFRASAIQESIRHLSITIENRYDGKFREEMGKLKGRIDIANLRTLMIFKEYENNIAMILKEVFNETYGLRVLFITVKSLEFLPHSFSGLIHLQYLKIGSPLLLHGEMNLPIPLSRFYHLKFLDLEDWHGSSSLPKDFCRLFCLRNFLANKELHSNVTEVGKMKHLLELKQFCVKKASAGFELSELGELAELGGELSICNLEKVASQAEASAANLESKGNLKTLRLVWGTEQPTIDVINALKPHHNLRALIIVNHARTTGPSWLCLDIWVKNLETLHLESVSWANLPPFRELPHLKELSLVGISVLSHFGPDYGTGSGQCFMHLKSIVFRDMPELDMWARGDHLFPKLESIQCQNCPKLRGMPFSESSFAGLGSLCIFGCPELSLPPMPHTSNLTSVIVGGVGPHSNTLVYGGRSLRVMGYKDALALQHMHQIELLSIEESRIPLTHGREYESVCKLFLGRWDFLHEDLDSSAVFPSVKSLELTFGSYLTRGLLSKMLSLFPELSTLSISGQSDKAMEIVIQMSSFSSLKSVSFYSCKGLALASTEDGGGAQNNISLLQSLTIIGCGQIFSRWQIGVGDGGAQTIFPFPASLRELFIEKEPSMNTMALLSNLTSLTNLSLVDCYCLTEDGFNPLITVNLKELMVVNSSSSTPEYTSIAAELLSQMVMPAGSFQLEVLKVDTISGVLVRQVCDFLASTLRSLTFMYDEGTEGFTQEQEEVLQLLISLQNMKFDGCGTLKSLPQGLHLLSSLKELDVVSCSQLQSLPEVILPPSLQKLHVLGCSPAVQEQIEILREKRPALFRI